MYYDKTIRYLEYLENGEKIRSAGFVKIEVTDQVCNIWVNVTGLYSLENCSREVRLRAVNSVETAESAKDKEGILGTILLRDGKGILVKKRLPIDRLCEGIGYHDLATVRINLGKNQELACRFKKDNDAENKLSESPEKYKNPLNTEKSMEMSIPDSAPQMPLVEISAPKPSSSQPSTVQPAAQVLDVNISQEPSNERPRKNSLAENVQQEPQKQHTPLDSDWVKQPYVPSPAIPPILHEKKWKQLSQIYPHIAPFRDERDYLSIGPGDFVVLPEKYYGLVNNSFLIHGFYNYGHMVLARTMKRGEEKFYIGVPGNFYEKERQVAIMFGFESFECRSEPAQEGDFGYYMIRVEL